MLQKSNERRLFLNNILQKSSGDDTSFTVQLGSLFTDVMRINLNSFICDNFFLNLSDLSINDGANIIKLIPDVYLSQNTFISWINQQLQLAGSTLLLILEPPQYIWQQNYLYISGFINGTDTPQQWSMVGSDWYAKLGFEQGIDDKLQQTHNASSPFDFAQSACVLIRFSNLPSAMTNTVTANFQINNGNSFGTRIERYFFNYNSNQCVVFSQPQQFNRLDVQLYDENNQILRTPNNNDSHISVVMNLSCYDQ